jgi:hypothetical protein
MSLPRYPNYKDGGVASLGLGERDHRAVSAWRPRRRLASYKLKQGVYTDYPSNQGGTPCLLC